MNERDLLAALRAAIDGGRVRVDLDCRRLLHTDSPIAVQADHNRWLYGVVGAAIAVGLGWDWLRGAVALGLGVVAYFSYGRPWIDRRMRARFFNDTLRDIAAFKRIWRLRGVSLCLVEGGDAARPMTCASPDADWRRFVLERVNPPEGGTP